MALATTAQPQWPNSFKLTCGQWAHKAVYDPRDMIGTLVETVITGTATKIAEKDLPGYYAGGVGFLVEADVTEPALLQTTSSAKVEFRCYSRETNTTGFTSDPMDCNGPTEFAGANPFPNVKGFNMLNLALPVPTVDVVSGKYYGRGDLKMRTGERIIEDGFDKQKYYDNVREMTCQLLP